MKATGVLSQWAGARRAPQGSGTRLVPAWTVLGAALLVALAAALGVIALHHLSDNYRQAEVVVARIEGLANRLKRLELQAESEQKLPPEVATEAQAIRRQMTQAFDQLTRLDPGGVPAQRVQAAFRQYQANNDELFRLFAAGKLAEAHAWDEARSDPSYDGLFDGMTSASATYQAEAQRTNLQTDLGATLMMALAAIVIGLLFWRFEQARRTADRLRTEQRALRHSEERFRSLIRNASDVIAICDVDGTLRYLSPATAGGWGYPPETLTGRNALDLVDAGDRASAQHLLAQVLQSPGTNIATELRLRHAEGGWRDFEVIANNLLADAGVAGIVATYRDITERKQAAAELAVARDQALEASRLKSEFLATMSHELRTPLNGIMGYTSLLLEGLSGELTAAQQRDVATIAASAERLLGLINDILDLSKLEAGQMNVQPTRTAIERVVDEAVATIRPLAEGKGLALEVAVPPDLPPAWADAERVQQIALNLLSNAVKFTDVGAVKVQAWAERGQVALRVADTGMGIPTAFLPHLFEPFRQADGSQARRHGGTGLGLAITKRLLDLQGGAIAVQSVPGAGSCFTIRLPQWRPPPWRRGGA